MMFTINIWGKPEIGGSRIILFNNSLDQDFRIGG
jgi:hypothetical protein